jgi:flagellar biosynthesis/type III secretory pathway protein FliH
VGWNKGKIKGKIEALEELYRFSLLSKKQMKKMIEPLKAQLQNLQSAEKSALEGRIVQIPCSSSSANEPSLTP